MIAQMPSIDSAEALWIAFENNPHNKDLRNRLVLHYAGLVRGIVHSVIAGQQSYKHMEDAVNEGLIALIDAIERFDAEKAVKFETYASIRVRGAVIDYFRRLDLFPRRVRTMAKMLRAKQEQLFMDLGRTPTDAEMADALQVSAEEYQKMLMETASLNILSFEELLYEKELSATASSTPEEMVEQTEFKQILANAVNALGEQERVVVSLYYLEGLKIKEIAGVLAVGASRVSQIHSAALLKLRRVLEQY